MRPPSATCWAWSGVLLMDMARDIACEVKEIPGGDGGKLEVGMRRSACSGRLLELARHFTVFVLLAAIVPLAAIALSFPVIPVSAQPQGGPGQSQNDAASGQDAGDTPGSALLVTGGRRTWSANLTPTGTDADWYRLDQSSAFCAMVDSTTNSPGTVTLASGATLDASVAREADPHRATILSLAAPAGRMPIFGLEPPMLSSMGASSGESGSPPSPGHYTFSLTAAGYLDLDPEADGEAPEAGSTAATAAPLPAGCSAGRLQGLDTEDRYAFDVEDPRDLTISFAIASGGVAQARVIDPSGAIVRTLASGDAADVWAGAVGRWYVVVSETAPSAVPLPLDALARGSRALGDADLVDTAYLLGVTDGPGDPAPCRPSCLG